MTGEHDRLSAVPARWVVGLRGTIGKDRCHKGLFGALALQVVCVFLLVADVGTAWFRELAPAATAEGAGAGAHQHILPFFLIVTLAAGTICSGLCLRVVRLRQKHTDGVLLETALSFVDLIERHFTEWKLTPSERHVALLAIKGLAIADIARLRQTKAGTIKSQCNAIYRKAGVSGRPQLISLFIDELLDDSVETAGFRNAS